MSTSSTPPLLKTKTGRLVLMVSVHLPWGGQKEYRRLKHAESINAQIESIMNNLPKGSLAVLAGDFNSPPTADTLRFLRGESGLPHHSTFWVDAWDEKGDGPCYTNDPASGNSNLERTARASGIPSPAMLPSRWIDYLLLRGWVYGSAGAPLQASLFGNRKDANGLHASDHFGIKVRVWDPEVR